ncbi:Cation-transporting ATPase 4 [Lasiodiplodia theobromae]|uniref:Cation-transporting ATPase 4 n=1 Tax=Lasiodiplodia theobromae TaxID=45133 RepID=UPI0015C33322|nr:Cation-transporting ATPase 4 [Lasiodiplodia theobromae]KAF4544307.1 Cation-transporting ATPase 4 [Lasiodiplodia theobromae]
MKHEKGRSITGIQAKRNTSNSASTATLVRLRYLFSYNDPSDYLYNIANIATWSIIESGIGLIAGSLPALRPLLKYVPFLGGDSAGSSDRTKSTGVKASSGGLTFRRSRHTSRHKLDVLNPNPGGGGLTTCEAGKRNWEELSDAESQKYILKESHVAVTHMAVADIEAGENGGSSQEAGCFDKSRFNK